MVDVPQLKLLSDSNLTLSDPNEDVRDRAVLDAEGEEVGHVTGLMIDPDALKVRFLQVGAGGFLGLGEESFLVPVDAVTRVEPEAVWIDRDRERLREAPLYQPDLVQDPGYYDSVYGWWQYSPYWHGGYIAPGYPYLPPR